MRLNEIEFTDALPVDGYGPGFFRVAGKVVKGHIALLPDGVHSWAGFEALEVLLSAEIDVLFVGTGAEMAPLPAEFRTGLEAAGIGVEPMASPAACRTYNILLSEGRRIGAALIAV